MGFIAYTLNCFIGERAGIIMFWIGYFRLEALISILLHILLLKHALDNGELSLPYVQEWP